MSRGSKSLLFLLQRCVAVRQVTLPTAIKTRCSSLLSGGCGVIQQRTWTSTQRAVCQLQSAVRASRYRFCTKAGAPFEEEYPPLPTYIPDPEPETKDVYIVHVKGLPWACSAQDVLQFFSECRIRDGSNGIHFTRTKQGRSTGQAFIEMEHEEDVSKALEKHRQYLGPRYVEVYEVTNKDAEEILKKAVHVGQEVGVVRLRGLPFSCTEVDIARFFSGLDIVENGITIVRNYRGKNTGNAYVKFFSKEAANEALRRDRQVIGNRYIEVFPSTDEEIHSSWRRRMRSASPQMTRPESADWWDSGPPQSSGQLDHYVHVRGLPFQVSGEDIVKFFYPLVVSKIIIECGPDGRLNGEADVYFSCHQDALAAMSRDRMHMGERYIELFLNSAPDSN
ncbi:LOW QUALITY PROTEIN: G-rich sequence factor 1 [Plectropomus leopardus]|uniref:LOW QUALITY PROTEIN: G-rich sequence factor 1 n=1 Tax=Plectropomus leopardus TaxID=160734 RepID=UPI001C4B77FD|nr:LOW QUALITY PROTEIN: G-rich sequence factor 1 [Plectropomus leopardus]